MSYKNIELIEIGKRVRRLRTGKDMSREQFAEKVGLSSETIKRIEIGCNYSMNTFLKLLGGLDTSADYLCFGKKNDKFREFLISLYENSEPDEFVDILKKLK